MATGAKFLEGIFGDFKANLEREYANYMAQHEEYITTQLASEQYTPGYGKINNIFDIEGNPKYVWPAQKGRWFIHLVKYVTKSAVDQNQITYTYVLYDNCGCTYIRNVTHTYNGRNHVYTQLSGTGIPEQLAVQDRAAAAECGHPLPNALIDFVKRLPADDGIVPYITAGNLGKLMQHYYSKFVEGYKIDEHKKANERIEFQREEIKVMKEKIAELDGQLKDVEGRAGRLDNELRGKVDQINGLLREMESMQCTVQDRDRRIGEVEAVLQDRDRRIGELEAALQDRDRRIGELESRGGELEGRGGELERDMQISPITEETHEETQWQQEETQGQQEETQGQQEETHEETQEPIE